MKTTNNSLPATTAPTSLCTIKGKEWYEGHVSGEIAMGESGEAILVLQKDVRLEGH